MYYALNTLAFPTLPTTPQASVASMIVPSEPVIGRLPALQVAGATSYAEARNEAQNNPPYVTVQPDPAAAAAAASSAESEIALSSDTTINVFPSLFLAQLMGQGDADPQAQSIIHSFEVLPHSPLKGTASPLPQSNAGPENAFLSALKEISGTPDTQQPQPVKSMPQPPASPPAPAQIILQPTQQDVSFIAAAERRFTGNVRAAGSNAAQFNKGTQAYRFTEERNALPEEVSAESASFA